MRTLLPVVLVLLSLTACKRTGPGDRGTGTGGEDGGDSEGSGSDDGDPDDTGDPAVDADGDGWNADEDCDDDDPEVHPGATELCNERDDDCDDIVDNDLEAPWCLTGMESCQLQGSPPAQPEPLVHLAFEDPDHPEANDGTLAADSWNFAGGEWASATGAVGQGLRLEKVGEGEAGNDYLYFPTHPDLEVETFTLSAWVKPGYDNSRMSIVNMLWDSAPAGFSFDITYGFLSVRLGNGVTIEAVQTPVPSEVWTHVAATYDGEQISLYVGGQLQERAQAKIVTGGVNHYPAHFLLGAYQNPLHYAYDGDLDELKIWDRALSGEELRRSLQGARYRFEGSGLAVDWGPNGLDEFDADDHDHVCGPVGQAWEKQEDEGHMIISAHPALTPTPSLGVHLWARPDGSQVEAILAQVEGAWALRANGEDLSLQVTCADGSTAAVTAADALRPTLWTELDAMFQAGHVRLFVDGEEVAKERADCFELAQSDERLLVGQDFTGDLDELEVSALPRSRAEISRRVTWSSWDSRDASGESTGVHDAGPLSLDLAGDVERLVADDERYPCMHLQAGTREGCARSTGSLESASSPALSGPLTLHGWVRPAEGGGEGTLLAAGGVALLLTEDGLAASAGEADPIAVSVDMEGRWTPVALAVNHETLLLFVDGVLVAEGDHDLTEVARTRRFALDSGRLDWHSASDLAWLEDSGVDGFAWTEADALARHAPWRTETRGLAVSSQLSYELSTFDWDAVADDLLASHADGQLDPEDETLSHYTRANAAFYLAEVAWQADETDEAFELALTLLEDIDHGDWSWSWIHGRALYWYASAYDRVASLLMELEAADPHTWSPRHAALRRRMASTLHHIGATGGINYQSTSLYDYGYHHPDPSSLGANSRLMSVGGSGHMALMMHAMADPDFGHAGDHLELSIDDLFYERGTGGEALGEQLPWFLHSSGLYVEGHGYQSDVFTGLTPFLVDWWQAGGEDRVTSGRVRAMYDANVAAMLPTGHSWPYATGWLQWQHHNPLVAELIEDSEPDAAEDYRWFADRQYLTETEHSEPDWTSAVLGDEALILRSDWSEDALWMGLKGRSAPCPASHCQEDQMSLMVVAHGAWLLIDPGDGRNYRTTPNTWKELWLQGAEGHNNVLVDGVGPGLTAVFEELDDPAVLTTSLLAERSDYGRMDGTVGEGLSSGGADHTRRVWLVDDAFFVLVDELEADGSATFGQQFHLGGPTTSGEGTLSTSGPDFTWQTTNDHGVEVDLDVVQLSASGDLSLASHRDGGTNFRYPDIWDHTYVHAEQSGASAVYMTLLLSGTADDPVPVATVLEDSQTLKHAEVELDSGQVIEVVWNGTGGRVAPGSADFDGVLSGTDGEGWAFLAEGSQLEVSADLGLWSSCELEAAQLELDGDALVGTVARDGSASCVLDLAWSGGEPGDVEVDGVSSSGWSFDGDAGVVSLDPAPGASFSIE